MRDRIGDIPADDGIKRVIPGRCKPLLLSHGGPAFRECLARAWGVDVSRIRLWADSTDSTAIYFGVAPE